MMMAQKQKQKRKILTDLDTKEVSLVSRGANLKDRFPVFKTEKRMGDMESVVKAVMETEVDGEDALRRSLGDTVGEQGGAAAVSAMRLLKSFADQLPSEAVAQIVEASGHKGLVAKQDSEEDEEDEKKKKKVDDESEYPPPDKKKQDDEEDEEDEENKKKREDYMTPDEMKKAVAKSEEATEAVLKQLKASEAALEEIKKREEIREWTQKAKDELAYFPGMSSDDLGKELCELNRQNPELAQRLFKSHKMTSDAMKQSSAFQRAGVGGTGSDTSSGSVHDRVVKMARQAVEKSADLEMTEAQAVAKVYKNNPHLYAEYAAENPLQYGGGRV